MLREQRESGLGSKEMRWKGARDMGAGHQEVWIALMKDTER